MVHHLAILTGDLSSGRGSGRCTEKDLKYGTVTLKMGERNRKRKRDIEWPKSITVISDAV
jgi:hypothetical protein